MTDELDLPEESFDYNEFVHREFGKKTPAAFGIRWFWWAVAVLLLIAFSLLYFRRF
jgi:hypothetical protein